MARKHMKKCSTSFVISKMQMKTLLDLENIMLREISQKQKNKYRTISLA